MKSNDPADSKPEPTDYDKAMVLLKGKVNELYDSEARVIANMAELINQFNGVQEQHDLLSKLPKRDSETVTSFMKVYNKIGQSTNPFTKPPQADDSLTPDIVIQYYLDNLTTAKFFAQRDLIKSMGSKYSIVSDLSIRNVGSKKIKSDDVVEAFLKTTLPNFASQTFQRVQRYFSILEDLDKIVIKYAVADPVLVEKLKGLMVEMKKYSDNFNVEIMYEEGREIIRGLIESEAQIPRTDIQRNPVILSLRVMENKLKACVNKEGIVDKDLLEKNLALFFTDAYLDHRSKEKGHTKKPPFLVAFEEKLIHFFTINNPNNKHNDELIFAFINGKEKMQASIVSHLFSRAVSEGVGSHNTQLFINSIKALDRIGPAAKELWNKLADDSKLSFSASLKVPDGEIKESSIRVMHSSIVKLPNVVREAQDKYASERLISLLKFDRPTYLRTRDLDELDRLVSRLENKNGDLNAMHKEVMQLVSLEWEREKHMASKEALSNPFLSYLENGIVGSRVPQHMDEVKANKDLVGMTLNVYVDTFLEGRTKSLLQKTEKTPFLQGLEKSIMATFNLQAADGKHPEEIILDKASKNAEDRDALVSRLFTRAMAVGIGDKAKQTFVNAAKLVVRMGDDGIKLWNEMVNENLSHGSALILPSKLSESQIATIYDKATSNSNRELKAEVRDVFKTDLLIRVLQKNSAVSELTSHQRFELAKIIKAVQGAEDDKTAHQAFAQAFIKVYINELKSNNSGLLNLLKEAVKEFNETVKGKSFLIGDAGSKKEGHIAAGVLSSVKDVESLKSITANVFARAVEDINSARKFTRAKDQKVYLDSFVSCLKAVVSMKALAQWEELVIQNNVPELSAKSLLGKKGEIEEKDLYR